jgi:hypothetical protein
MNSRSELQLSAEEMRKLGYRVVDMLVSHLASLRTSAASLGILCCRYSRQGLSEHRLEEIHRGLVPRLIEDGTAMVSSTVLRSRTVLHFCFINPRTTEDDVRVTLDRLKELAERS